MHTVKEMDMLATKIYLLLKKFDERATEVPQGTVKTMDSQMMCEVCGNVGHLGNDCPDTREKKHRTSTMGTTSKEVITMAGTTNPVHHSKVIQTLTPITIRINLHLRMWFYAKLK
jgi:hypothetical protein